MHSLRLLPHNLNIQVVTRLGCLLVMAVGIVPIPLPPENHRSLPGKERFPCENGTCGCRSADQCWRSCCCKSNVEKLAWARENGVEPPSFVKLAAKKEAAGPVPINSRKSCCCRKDKHRPETPDDTSQAKLHEVNDKYALVLSALACQGNQLVYQAIPVTEIGNAITLERLEVESQASLFFEMDFYRSVSIQPPTPPPKRMHLPS